MTIQIDEKDKKWMREIAEKSLAFENMSNVAKFCIKYVKQNPEVLPK